jgi:hypothetical protein
MMKRGEQTHVIDPRADQWDHLLSDGCHMKRTHIQQERS